MPDGPLPETRVPVKRDLDRDANAYLERWKVPANQYTAVRPVTLRGILSHLGGFTVSGFPDKQPTDSSTHYSP